MKRKAIRHRPQRNRPKFSKIIVALMLATVLIFTVAMTVIFCRLGMVPDTLITAFFAFAGGEAGFLGLIKYSDNKYDKTDASELPPEGDDEGVG